MSSVSTWKKFITIAASGSLLCFFYLNDPTEAADNLLPSHIYNVAFYWFLPVSFHHLIISDLMHLITSNLICKELRLYARLAIPRSNDTQPAKDTPKSE